jgi:hypothetical protein
MKIDPGSPDNFMYVLAKSGEYDVDPAPDQPAEPVGSATLAG